MPQIDLNADLGESFGVWVLGDDAAMLDIVTSANIACGFHAGDALTLQRTCAMAAERGVVIGAQVSYRDLAGFGRRAMAMDPAELSAEVIYQLGALDGMCRVAGTRVRYVKPHGALYNVAAVDDDQAQAIVTAVGLYDPTLPILGLPGSRLLAAAREAGLIGVPEAFTDRAYLPDGRLVPRNQPGAVVHDPAAVAARAVELVTTGHVRAIDGSMIEISAESLCTHGDSPDAVGMARAVRTALEGAGVTIRSFIEMLDEGGEL